MKKKVFLLSSLWFFTTLFGPPCSEQAFAERAIDYQAIPPFLTNQAPPLVMLVMGRNHKLYYEAYNDASDLNDDGIVDVGYTPSIEYYGYFDSHKCYEYNSALSRFEPRSITADKTCQGDTEWSGDFLNYLTMSRMDTMRKVLYGGYRSTDTAETVLERVFIPQDAHSWGKEYTSVDHDGYDITEYTPLPLPVERTRHLFSSTTLDTDEDGDGSNDPPVLRVLPDSPFRIWDWVAKPNPVCDDSRQILSHPQSHEVFDSLIDYFTAEDLEPSLEPLGTQEVGSINGTGNPFGADENYLTLISGQLVIGEEDPGGEEGPRLFGFIIDGSDAVELLIDGKTPENWVEDESVLGGWRYAGEAAWYGEHDACGDDSDCAEPHQGWVELDEGTHTIELRQESSTGGSYSLRWWPSKNSGWVEIPELDIPNSVVQGLTQTVQTVYSFDTTPLQQPIEDYQTRVVVCDPNLLEANCQHYPDGGFKPVGLLQQYGETDKMYFGLLTGSYAKNKSGGVLRKNISSISDEIDISDDNHAGTGRFTGVDGIIKTINNLRTVNFTYTEPDPFTADLDPSEQDSHWYTDCTWRTNRTFNDGECSMWGNPIGEMMYEGLRYFAGGGRNGSTEFVYSGDTPDSTLDLPLASWNDPYATFPRCAKPYMLVLSDINPTFDSDQMPGSSFGAQGGDLPNFNADALAGQISTNENINGDFFIGEQGETSDGVCSAKNVTNFGDIRGLCPEEPTKEGSYYSAAAAYYGATVDINPVDDDQHVSTMIVGLASPLPNIEIAVGLSEQSDNSDNTLCHKENNSTTCYNKVTLVPMAKTVAADCGELPGDIDLTISDGYQPTDTIADFFVEEITQTFGKFRINFEDLEQGGDFDQDSIAEYEYQVVDAHDEPVDDPADGRSVIITLNSTAASGCLIQNIGYVISGTSEDGTYLEVRDFDTPEDGDPLPLIAERTFTVDGSHSSASLLKNPLWYAAKWGGFDDSNSVADATPVPDDPSEWDKNGDGIPDNYFYVSNPLYLSEQLNNSFAEILKRVAGGTAAAVISSSRSGGGAVYQSIFYPQYADGLGNAVSWAGEVRGLFVDSYGNIREDTNDDKRLDISETQNEDCTNVLSDLTRDLILVFDGSNVTKYNDVNGNMKPESCELFSGPASVDEADIHFLWNTSEWLNSENLNAVFQRTYTFANNQMRYIFTSIDSNNDGILEQVPFVQGRNGEGGNLPSVADLTDPTKLFTYLTLYPSFVDEPVWVRRIRESGFLSEFLQIQTNRVINYIRGEDQDALTIGGIYSIPAMRNRRFDSDSDGDGNPDKTWRLGDIVHSSPTLVGRPAEGYHLLYKDLSYAAFAQKYHKRRNVIYTGGNDGMIHAFNAGFPDVSRNNNLIGFNTTLAEPCLNDACTSFTDWNRNGVRDGGLTGFELGQELWAYIPYNLLPHLYWLTETSYSHVYYNDLKPKIFDARIFPEDDDHPGGWGTVMVVGMRLGGGKIQADMDKTDGTIFNSETDRTMSSAYVIFDITNPEVEPKVLTEISFPHLGYTTCYPAVIPMLSREKNESDEGSGGAGVGVGENPPDEEQEGTASGTEDNQLYTFGSNDWYLVFGSGPADADGQATPHPSATAPATVDIPEEVVSKQFAKLYVVDLKELGLHGQIRVVRDDNGTLVKDDFDKEGENYIQDFDLDPKSFISDPVAVDYDKDFNTDAVYFGTVSGDESSGWGGKLRRLVIDNETDVAEWLSNSVLFDAEQPVTAAPSIALGNNTVETGYNKWIYFGTGRFLTRRDAENGNQQSYYGIKEPVAGPNDGTLTWHEVTPNTLLDVNEIEVRSDRSVHNLNGVTDWTSLIHDMDLSYSGWKYDLYTDPGHPSERNLGQAALLGELLTFTTYTPAEDICAMEGESSLYALYYKTGTSFYRSTFRVVPEDGSGSDPDEGSPGPSVIEHKFSLGQGMTTTPALHTGRESGSKAFVQTSEGGIKTVKQENPGATKSGKHTWRVRKQ